MGSMRQAVGVQIMAIAPMPTHRGRRCTICARPDRGEIEATYRAYGLRATLSRYAGLTASSLYRHLRHALDEQVTAGAVLEAEEAALEAETGQAAERQTEAAPDNADVVPTPPPPPTHAEDAPGAEAPTYTGAPLSADSRNCPNVRTPPLERAIDAYAKVRKLISQTDEVIENAKIDKNDKLRLMAISENRDNIAALVRVYETQERIRALQRQNSQVMTSSDVYKWLKGHHPEILNEMVEDLK